jgi:hypothetical protein
MRALVIAALLLGAVLFALNLTGSESGRTLPEASATDRTLPEATATDR